MQFSETSYPETKIFLLKKKRLISKIKKIKRKNNLRKQLPSKLFFSSKNTPLFFIKTPTAIEIQIKNKLATLLSFYTNSTEVEQIYRDTIENTGNEHVYRFFYNKLSGKIQTYQLIDTDRGSNFVLTPNLFTKITGTLFKLVYILPIAAIPGMIAGAGHVGLKTASDNRKVNKTKNKLDHCIPEDNFIKLLSILLTKTHEPEFSYQENTDLFLENTFKNFWSLFKQQAKTNPNKEHLNQFWSTCLMEYFKELKCPLMQENFYENLTTMTNNNPQIAITPSFARPETHLQLLLVIHFIKAWLIQLSMQTLIQQKSIKFNEPTSLALRYYPSTRFFNNAVNSQPYIPSYSIPPTALNA
jgi:hypothetical protein